MTASVAEGAEEPWPRTVFEAPALRGLDARAKADLCRAGALEDFADGAIVYEEGQSGDAFFVVLHGTVELGAREDEPGGARLLRAVRRGETFGEDAALPGELRRLTARAHGPTRLARIPIAVFLRASGRAGSKLADRELRALRRMATRDLVRSLTALRQLPEADLELLLDAAEPQTYERGSRIFSAGQLATHAFLIVDGVVQVEREDAERISVQGYLTRGDLAGDEAALGRRSHAVTAVAQGRTECLSVPGQVLRTLADRNPGVFTRLRRVQAERQAEQLEVLAAAGSTQHVFRDLYRMQMARALLAIDQDTCVRCGHCAWACSEMHGVARLVRRGDKVVTRLDLVHQARGPSSLLLPNTCQHCKNPVCMPDCPTGAIGRDAEGEVFILDELCTGCGACAKACPWENIQMAPRSRALPEASSEVAVKCDLCRDFEAPACVQVCPTESILRLDPSRDFAEVERMLGSPQRSGTSRAKTPERQRASAAVAASVAFFVVMVFVQASGAWEVPPSARVGFGLLAGLGFLLLGLYVVPKRRVGLWMRRRPKRSLLSCSAEVNGLGVQVRSKLRPYFWAHLVIGFLAMAVVALHGRFRFDASLAGALDLSFWITAALGVVGALAYRIVPPRLSRIERDGKLTEDLRYERQLLIDRLYREASGKSELVKKIVERILVPYARSPVGPWLLVTSGLSLQQEEANLRARIERLLEGRGRARLGGLNDLIRTVVEHRALPARRLLTRALSGWLVLHIVATSMTLSLLVLHIVSVVK